MPTPRQTLISRAGGATRSSDGSHGAAGTGSGAGAGAGAGGGTGPGSGSGSSKGGPPAKGSSRSWFLDSQAWKRFSVLASIALSIVSLIVSSVASLAQVSAETIRALTVTGIIVNAVSVVLSAATSLDWRTEAAKDKAFLDKLLHLDLVQVQDDGKVELKRGLH